MSEATTNAFSFEAVKVSMHQTKDGIKITLVIHPNEVPQGLFSDPVGQRYQMAMVGIADDGQPIERDRTAQHAAVLCKDPMFQKWVARVSFAEESEAGAAAYIREYCDVKSRSNISKSPEAMKAFDGIVRRYMESKP